MPKYFATYGLKEPTGLHHSILAFANGDPEATPWEVMNREPERMRNFMFSMDSFESAYPFLASFDLSPVLAKATESPQRAVLVDVGGGKGHALKAIAKATPGLPVGRCVLQDLPEVVEATRSLDDAEIKDAQMIGIDFHKEQPIKGQRTTYIYFLGFIVSKSLRHTLC